MMITKIFKLIFFIITACLFLIFATYCSDNSAGNNDKDSPDTSGTTFEPPDGECLFILGQADEQAMDAYVALMDSTLLPAGFAFYTSLSGSITQNDMARYKSYLDKYPNTVLQLAIWTGSRDYEYPGYYLDEIIDGDHDASIFALANACKEFNKPIFIRFGYEFDGSHNAYPPDKYIAAYKYFVDRMRYLGVTNVAYVWHSWGTDVYYGHSEFPQYYPDLPDSVQINQALWYPGDDYVDWVAMSIFGSGWGDLGMNNTVQWLISYAGDHEKPVMIAESAAIRTSGGTDSDWVIPNTSWFVNVFSLIDNNNSIKAFTYINVDWVADNPSSTWGDTRVQAASQTVFNYWRNEIKSFLHAGTDLYSIINYQE
jgi:hypothetical protein